MTIDPRTRIILNVFLTLNAIMFTKLGFLAATLLAALMIACMFSDFKPGIKRLKWFAMFFVLIVLTTGDLTRGLCFLCRVAIILISASLLTYPGTRTMIQGMIALKVPYDLAFASCASISFIPILSDEFKNALISIQMRGVKLETLTFRKKILLFVYLITPVIEGVLVKAKELSCSMEMRAFRAYETRSSYITISIKKTDYAIITLASVVFAFGLFMYWRA